MRRFSGVLMLVVAILFAGCAGKSTPTYQPRFYSECYEPIAKLEQDESNAEETKGAVGGALLGALGGALIGGLASGRWEGAVAGAVAGGVAGGFAGFYKARLDKIQNQNERLQEYQKMLGEQSAGWDLQRASVEQAYKCYDHQIDLLEDAIRKKQITRETFLERMADIKSALEHINSYWADAQHRMDEMLADGQNFLNGEDARAQAAAEKKAAQQARVRASAVREQTHKKNAPVNAGLEAASKKVALAIERVEESSQYGLFDLEIPAGRCPTLFASR